MQQFTQKYTIVQLLENIPEGTIYSWKDWPLHVTIADVFAINWSAAILIKELTQLLKKHQPITITAGNDTYFGLEKQIQVVLLNMTKELLTLHYDIVTLLEQGDVTFNNPQFTRSGFLAHSTVRPHARLQKDDLVTFDALSLIDMFPGKDPYQRQIVRTMRLSGL